MLYFAEFTDLCGFIADKRCQGLFNIVQVIAPKNKKSGITSGVTYKALKRYIYSDLIVVENYFGGLCGIWNFLKKPKMRRG